MGSGKKDSGGDNRKSSDLTEILEILRDEASGGKIKIDNIVKTFNHRGFGPLLLAPAMIIILPTGAIPGVPALCSLFIILVSVQILLKRRHPWLPKRFRDASIEAKKIQSAVQILKPYTQKIDRYVKNRLSVLSDNEISQRIVALVTLILAVMIIFIGFIPIAPALLALPILFFALGLSVHDGILLTFGYTTLLLSIFLMSGLLL